MLIPLENAAKTFVVPFDDLYLALQSEHRALQYIDRVLCVQVEAVVKVLGISREDFLNLKAGREWFMSEKDIAANYGPLYGNDHEKFLHVAGGEVLKLKMKLPVYRASPFIKLAMMSEEDRAALLEGRNGGTVGPGHEGKGKPVRTGLGRSRKDRVARRNRTGQSKRLGS